MISSTVIVPIIHVKNKAGVCSSILKIKMKNENCHKTELLAQKENSTFGLSDEYQQGVVFYTFAARTSRTCQRDS